jgi:hypothetical protein
MLLLRLLVEEREVTRSLVVAWLRVATWGEKDIAVWAAAQGFQVCLGGQCTAS